MQYLNFQLCLFWCQRQHIFEHSQTQDWAIKQVKAQGKQVGAPPIDMY